MHSRFLVLLLAVLYAAPAAGQRADFFGSAFGFYVTQNSDRGGTAFSAIGWAGAQVQSGSFAVQTMLSLDPLTLGECGYPRLLATAGLCQQHPFEDRGHRHPLFMQLQASASAQIASVKLGAIAGLAGEPALGPTGYMHRASAVMDPVMPLTHHDLNPTHIVNGLVTAELEYRRWAVQASAFNTEQDKDLYDFDLGSIDSYSGRLLYRLPQAELQFSAGQLDASDAGAAHAGHALTDSSILVLTTSAQTTRNVGSFVLAATLAASRHSFDQQSADALLGEAHVQRDRHALMLRAESLERIEYRHEVVEGPNGEHDHIAHPIPTRINELVAVYALRLLERRGWQTTVGVRGALTFIPEFTRIYYGTPRSRSIGVYVNLRPSSLQHHH